MDDKRTSTRRKGRKWLRFESEWVRKKRKTRKDSGEAYTTYKGDPKPAKQLVAITCRCHLRCSQKLDLSERKHIFDEFYKLKDNDAQNKYLFGLIHKQAVKRKRAKASTKRSVTYRYYLRCSNGTDLEVCKKTFCDIHAVGKRRIEKLCEKVGALTVSDCRGRHHNRPRTTSEEVKAKIREHIQSFPRRQSHYSQSSNRHREYLPEGLSIAEMHRLYLAKHEPEAGDKPVVKEWLYRKIFNEEFNLGFGYPRSDTCQMCDGLRIAIEAASDQTKREELNLELAEHQFKASLGYQHLREDTQLAQSDSNVHVITFDLQQNLPVPTLTHSAMFYLRQLWVYNFGIHECSGGNGIMCVWNECIAGRGSDEIASCLLRYFTELRSTSTKLVCYSDSCFGQNKNFTLVCLWNWFINRKMYKQIDHKFLVRGHTFLPNDRDFSHIEKRKAAACVFVPQQWEDVITSARQANPFRVQQMSHDSFLDFSELEKEHTRRKTDLSKNPVLISKVTWMNFGQAEVTKRGKTVTEKHSNELWLKYSYDTSEEWSRVTLLKGRKKTQPTVDLCLPEKYPDGHAVKSKKIEDLVKMIPYIPTEHRHFYEALQEHITAENVSDDEYGQ